MTDTDMHTHPHTQDKIRLPRRMYDDVVAHALRDAPMECVGVIAFSAASKEIGDGLLGTGVVRMEAHNRAMKPNTTFYVEPYEQFQIEHALEEQGYGVDLIYHSHPQTPAFPSGSDLLLAGNRLMVIVSLAVDPPDLKCWKIVHPENPPEEIEIELFADATT